MQIKSEQIEQLETRYRANLINSLGGFKSVVLIGTNSTEGNTNLAIFNSLFHLGANPALCGFIVRPDVSPRHTMQNILDTKYFTVNHLNEGIYENAHQTSARYAADVSEFDEVKLTRQYAEGFSAPFVEESYLKFGCEFQQKIDIEINGTSMIIAKIIWIDCPDAALLNDGFIDLEIAGTLASSGLDSYHKTEEIARLTYAKPDKWPTAI
jgi:flavin reductase (DIM6/NTAB) family NADH-FMN oxidoreductase RutF